MPKAIEPQLFNRTAFRKLALGALAELQEIVCNELASHELEELQMMSIWKRKLPSFKNDALSVLFDEFEGINEQFDFGKTATELCTLAHLSELVKGGGVQRVCLIFQKFFESRAFQEWQILIPLVNVQRSGKITDVHGDVVHLRYLHDEERQQLGKLHFSSKLEDLYFSVEEKAGDAETAVAKAREHIDEFLAPYYLHRIKNADRWWRPRTLREIVSPLAFYFGPNFGVKREVRQLRTQVAELFTPASSIDPNWKRATEELARSWSAAAAGPKSIGEGLRLCSHWMFSAESEELLDNAFLKHVIAWEALLPSTASRARRCWYLLLLCLGAADPLTVQTLSQASRLIDRRNSLAHPELSLSLHSTMEEDLIMLKQSVWWGFDRALEIWRLPDGPEVDWSDILTSCYNTLLSDKKARQYAPSTLVLLKDLGYTELDNDGMTILGRYGQRLRVEAHIARACELWHPKPSYELNLGEDPLQNPKESVSFLARALKISVDEKLPLYEYHAWLSIRERSETMKPAHFKDGWKLARLGDAPPTKTEIAAKLAFLESHDGMSRQRVGLKK